LSSSPVSLIRVREGGPRVVRFFLFSVTEFNSPPLFYGADTGVCSLLFDYFGLGQEGPSGVVVLAVFFLSSLVPSARFRLRALTAVYAPVK